MTGADIEKLHTLSAGADLIGLDASDLRSGIRRGDLTPVRIGRRYFVTVSDLRAFVDKCRAKPKDQDCGSAQEPAANRSGSSSIEAQNTARAAALATARALRERSPATSKASTSPRPRAAN